MKTAHRLAPGWWKTLNSMAASGRLRESERRVIIERPRTQSRRSDAKVRVTCASAGASLPGRHIDVAHDAPVSDRINAIHQAIALAVETHETVQVRY